MKTNFTNCCEKCLEKIAKLSASVGRTWLDLCHLQNNSAKLLFSEDNPNLELLERLGFLVSCETPEHIAVRLLNRINADGHSIFCVEGDHD